MTTLVGWAPFRDLDLMERRLRRLFDEVGLAPSTEPAVDVYETPEEVVLEVEVPGYEEKDLALEVTDHTLVVKGEVKEEKEAKEKTYLLHERLEKTFERRFRLPEQADTARLAATFKKGVLEIHAPKIVEAKPRAIEIGKG